MLRIKKKGFLIYLENKSKIAYCLLILKSKGYIEQDKILQKDYSFFFVQPIWHQEKKMKLVFRQ